MFGRLGIILAVVAWSVDCATPQEPTQIVRVDSLRLYPSLATAGTWTCTATQGTVVVAGDGCDWTAPANPTSSSVKVIACSGGACDTASGFLTASSVLQTLAAGFWGYPNTLCNGDGVTANARTATSGAVLGILQTARKCGVRVVLVPNRTSITTTGTTNAPFSLDSAKAYTDRLARVLVPDTLRKYDATLIGFNLADDYGSTAQWGGTTVSQAQIQAWAQYVKAKLPSLRLGVRVEPTWVTASLAVYLDYAWAQYHEGKGDAKTFFDNQAAKARGLGLALVTGVNTTHCAGQETAFCTPAQVRTYMGMAVQRPESCGAFAWDYDTQQMAVTGMAEAWAYVLGLAANKAGVLCKHA